MISGGPTLEEAVLRAARTEAQEQLERATAQAAELRREAEVRTEAEARRLLEEAQTRAETLAAEAGATAQLEAQRLLLERREALLARVLAEARTRLTSLPARGEYAALLRRWVREAVQQLVAGPGTGGVFHIRADPAGTAHLDRTFLDALGAELSVTLELGAPLEEGAGVIVEDAQGQRRFDNTLERRLARREEVLRGIAYRVLSGEEEA